MTGRPFTIWILTALLVVLGISAVLGGGSMVLDPSGAGLGVTPELLDDSPFADFRIPGFILLALFGFGSLTVAHGVWHRAGFPFLQNVNPVPSMHWGWTGAVFIGVAHMGWIAMQVLMIGYASLLQPIFALLGAAIAVLAFAPPAQRYLRGGTPGR